MTIRRPTLQLVCAATGVFAFAMGVPTGGATPSVQAQASHHDSASDREPPSGDFVKAVRAATARFRDLAVAEAEGYALMFGCVSGPDSGAMGLHYVNLTLVGDGLHVWAWKDNPTGTFSNWHSKVSCDAFSAATA